MFQISGEKESKSKKKGDPDKVSQQCFKNFPPDVEASFHSTHNICLDANVFFLHLFVCSCQIGQWWQRRGDKISQIKEEVHSWLSIHVPNIWRQGQRQREEEEERQVHLQLCSPDEPLKSIQRFLLCVFQERQTIVMTLTWRKRKNQRRKRVKGRRKR